MIIENDDGLLTEFKNYDFIDARRNKRFKSIVERLQAAPSGNLTKVFVDAKDLKGAYRFFQNDKTPFTAMLEAHQRRVSERCTSQNVILAIQDSTTVHLPGAAKAKGINKIGGLKRNHPGLNVHSTLLLTPSRIPMGVADLQIYERELISPDSREQHYKLPAEEKETGRWLKSIENVRKSFGNDLRLVWISDREADFWDYFAKLIECGEQFVQRVTHNRPAVGEEQDYFELAKQAPVVGVHRFEVGGKGGKDKRPTRTATCEVRSTIVSIKRPKKVKRGMKHYEVRVIHVLEKTKTPSKSPLEWFIVTNIPCESSEDILEKIRWYCLRWTIEELHRTFKSGCEVEEMRLEFKNSLLKLLFLLFVTAMRILWISKLANQGDNELCTEAFSEEEWKLVYWHRNKRKPPPDYTPTLKEMVKWVAALGGFYEYIQKRVPGAMTLWRGMRRLGEMMATYDLLLTEYMPIRNAP